MYIEYNVFESLPSPYETKIEDGETGMRVSKTSRSYKSGYEGNERITKER